MEEHPIEEPISDPSQDPPHFTEAPLRRGIAPHNTQDKTHYYLAALVSLVTFAVYLLSLRNNFVEWDDGIYVYDNPYIRSLNLTLLKWSFLNFYASNWHPLAWISHALDYAVWGLNPLGHHLTNNILHAANTFLVVLLVVRLLANKPANVQTAELTSAHDASASVPGPQSPVGIYSSRFILVAAGVTGLLFGLHPIHVESVAWISERKDLLCAFFFLLSIMHYMKYVHVTTPRTIDNGLLSRFLDKRYLWALIYFTLALLSKPMAVSLPLVLLLLDWYPFERIHSVKSFWSASSEKGPFLLLSGISSILTILAQKSGAALTSLETVSLSIRILVAVKAFADYLANITLPVDLAPFYPYPENISPWSLEWLLPIIILVGITAICVLSLRKTRLCLSAWIYFIVTLLPVSGVVQIGRQSMADRFMYLPSISPFLVAGLITAWVSSAVTEPERKRSLPLGLPALTLAATIFICMSYLTIQQIGVWKNTYTMWSRVIEKDPSIPFVYNSRGAVLYHQSQLDEAIADYTTAIALDPSLHDAYRNRGLAFEKKGELDRALEDYSKAISLNPSDYRSYYNRGLVLEKKGELNKAMEDYDKVLAMNPSVPGVHLREGVLFGRSGSLDKAIEHFTKEIELNPAAAHVYWNRGTIYMTKGNNEAASADFQRACVLGNRESCKMLQTLMTH